MNIVQNLEEFNTTWRVLLDKIVWEFEYQIRYALKVSFGKELNVVGIIVIHIIFFSTV